VLEQLQCADLDELKIRMGRGEIAVHRLLEVVGHDSILPLKLMGMKRMLMHAAECCHPIPGDPVLGQFSSGEGMILHHRKCPSISEQESKDFLEVEWEAEAGQLFKTGIEVRSRNKRGMLASVTQCIADASSSIEDLKLKQRGGAVTELLFLVEVEDRVHLAQVLRSIKAVDGVVRVGRRNQVGLSGKPESRALAETLRDFFSRKHASPKSDGNKETKT